ncbi:MAG TPA: carboxymuconolactone decarboxylase family protein [Chloroflexota bacterium]|nr:carboxymuconolactone decarboxylase family protein [Chloroflexota bacterium]
MPRLPRILTKDQLPPGSDGEVIDYLVQTRGFVSPGFGAILNNPNTAHRIAQLGTYIRFESTLPSDVREITAMTSAREMGGTYEQSLHARDAVAAGVSQAVVDAVNAGLPLPASTPEPQVVAIDAARQLTRTHRLKEATWQELLRCFGEAPAVDVLATVGYYAMLAVVHNALEVFAQA